MGYKVDINAAPKQLQEMMQMVIEKKIDTAKELKPIAPGVLPTKDNEQDYKMYLAGPGTWSHPTLPSGEGSLLNNQIGTLFWDKDEEAWALTNVVDLPTAPTNGQVAKGDSNAVSGGEVYESTALKTHGKNYIDYTALKNGFFVNEANGALSANASYKATEYFIKISPNTSYTGAYIRRLAYYSAPNQASFISGAVPNISTATAFTTPSGANYIRVSVDSNWSQMYLGLTSEYTGFVPYEKVLEPNVKAQSITNELRESILSGAAKITESFGKNRNNPENFTDNKYVNAFTGLLVTNADYRASGFVYVGDLPTYTISPSIRHLAKYSAPNEGSYISGVEFPASNTVTRTTENYVRFSMAKSQGDFQLEAGSIATPFEPFTMSYKITQGAVEVDINAQEAVTNNILIPSPANIYLAPSVQYNLYFRNAFISDFGFPSVNVVDAQSTLGQLLSKKYRATPTSGQNASVLLRGYIDGRLGASKSIMIRTATNNSGSGLTRDAIFMGDSTINQNTIIDHFKTYFDTDVMSVNLLGTRTTPSGNKHEGRSGWTIDDYYSKAEKSGVSNPFYNPATSKFDFAYYLAQTSQTMGANGWFMFQLGINDLYAIASSKNPIDALSRVDAMMTKLNFIIASVKAVNADIRIGISMTIPPASEQSATGILLNSSSYNKEAYEKMGLKAWWSALLNEFESRTAQKIYLVPNNLFLDTENNFKTSTIAIDNYNTNTVVVQNDDVHPSANGYKQMADIYIGIVKYFG